MFQGMEYVYEVYRERSFSRAAAKLFISQPSLSANVKRIEKRIGYPIFNRGTKPLGLTECGVNYIKAVEKIMAAEHEFREFVDDWGGLKTGNLVLGGTNFFSSWVLPPLMAEFANRYPLIKISLIEESTMKLSQLLQNGAIDFVMDNCLLEKDIFDSCIFQAEHLVLAVPKSFSINGALREYQISMEEIRSGAFLDERVAPVPIGCFGKEPFIMLRQENDTGKRARKICQRSSFHPRVAFELDQQMTSYNITCSGMGISFLGDTLISRVPENQNLFYYKLPEESSDRNIYLYWKKGSYFTRAMEEFLRGVQKDGGETAF